ncbi:MAG: hypothetical protein H6811_00635 [Phycisphaeraceae bacterium]|nr:hypothetical protein [Phycisphaeraceae bacterium]
MPSPSISTRSVWEDRFQTPTAEALLGELGGASGGAVARVMGWLNGLKYTRQGVSWCGVPWRWTLVTRCRGDGGQPLAYVVPDPKRPLLAFPLPASTVCGLDIASLTRCQRDLIAGATKVGPVLWIESELIEPESAEEAFAMVAHRHSTLVRSGGRSTGG